MDLLRNAAAERGADTVYVEPPQVRTTEDGDTMLVTGLAYRCAAPQFLPDGRPVPEGSFIAVLRRAASARVSPYRSAPHRASLMAGTRVLALAETFDVFRRVRALDGTAIGYVEDDALEPAR